MRYGPNSISINSSTALKTIYHPRANVQKSGWYKIFRHAFDIPNSLTMIDKERHGFKRRILSQGLTTSAIKLMEDHIFKNTDIFYENLTDKERKADWSSARNMSDWTGYLTFDIMGDLCFGRNWNIMKNETNRDLTKAFSGGVWILSLVC